MSRGGFGADPELLSPAFQFIAPVVGPLGKEEISHTVLGPSLSFGRNNWSAPESLLTHTAHIHTEIHTHSHTTPKHVARTETDYCTSSAWFLAKVSCVGQ